MFLSDKMKRRLASSCIGFFLCIPLAHSADREILPTESESHLRTRGVGLQDMLVRMPTEQQLESCDFGSEHDGNNPNDIKAGSIYIRMMWQHFEPQEGEFAWEKLDRILECANKRGQSVDLRLMLTYPGHKECSAGELEMDPDCIAYETLPDWLLEQVNTHTTDVFADAEYPIPDWSDAVFIEKHTTLIQALGEKYNNHPDLNSLDIGSVGAWGEWHIYGASQYMPTLQEQKDVIDLYKTAFPNTPLLAGADSFYIEESSDFGELSTYLRDAIKTGWRGDSWGLPYFNDERYQAIHDWMPDAWKTNPVNIETSDILSTWSGANIDPSQEQATKDVQSAFDDAIEWHVSQINLKGDSIPDAFSETFKEMSKKLGFRLVLRKAVLPESILSNTPLSLALEWENVGIAPPYRDFRIALQIKDQLGEVKAQTISEQSVKGWLPEQLMQTTPSLTLPADLVAGDYTLEVALVFNSAVDRTLPIAVEGSGEDDWYPLGAVTIINQAPVASDAVIVSREDQQATATLVATDPENQSLTYRVTQAPTYGQLTGDLPDVIYNADEEHPGTDSFNYVASDGQLDSNEATVTLNIYPVITEGTASNGLALGDITVDGDKADWADVTSFGIDGDDLSDSEANADWQDAWMVHDDKRLYIAYQNNGPIDTTAAWAWSIYLDVDPEAGTGFKANSNLSADYLLSGKDLYRYTGSGSDWSWEYISAATDAVIQDDFAEISVLRSVLGNPSDLRVLFRADNSARVGSYLVDNYPNGSDAYFTYTLGESAENSIITTEVTNVLTAPLTIDGDLLDWASIASFGLDGNDITDVNSQADILEVWMAHDETDFYFAYQNDGDINTTTWWPWQVFLDTDSDASSGMQVGNDIGAEYMIQGSGLYKYTGSGSDWLWQYIEATSNAVDGDIAEFKVSRSVLGMPYALRSVMIARNNIFTGINSASSVDYYPDQESGHLSYRFKTSASNVVETALEIDGDLSDWATLSSLGEDGDDVTAANSQADFLETWLAHDAENLYLAFTNDGPINQSTMWPWQVFFDTDSSTETGYKVGTAVGGNFMLQGRSLYQYTGTGENWSWEVITAPDSSVVDNIAEFKIPRASLGETSDLNVVFKASNWTFTGNYSNDEFDYFPNNADGEVSSYISYDMSSN